MTEYQILAVDDPKKPWGLVKSENNRFYYYDKKTRKWVKDIAVCAYFMGEDSSGFDTDEKGAMQTIEILHNSIARMEKIQV